MKLNFAIIAVAASTVLMSTASADHHIEAVLTGLDNPCGVAIQPGTGHLFVSDSGAGKIVRVVDGKAEDVITDFPIDVYGKGPMYNIGPLGLAFLGSDTLVVGGGGLADGEELLRVYMVPAVGSSIKADAMAKHYQLAGNDDIKGEGNFYALAANDQSVFVTCNGDDTKGWVSRATISGGSITGYERFLATKEATQVDAPVAVTFNKAGRLVVGQMGEINVPQDGLVTIYNPKNGKMLQNHEVGLNDITALAYSPKNRLYAADFNWLDTSQGGLHRIMFKKEGDERVVSTKKIVGLDKPTAMVFDAEGMLYVTVIGTSEGGSKGGKLLKINMDL